MPTVLYYLPSSASVYECPFRDIFNSRVAFGGPHETITKGYLRSGHSASHIQVMLMQQASAYLRAPYTFISSSNSKALESEDFKSALIKDLVDELIVPPVSDEVEPAVEQYFSQLLPIRDLASHEQELLGANCSHICTCADIDNCYKAQVPLSKLKGLVDEVDIPQVTDYRCPTCSNCPVCKRSAREKTKSLQEAFEQDVIEKSVTLDLEKRKVWVYLPFIKEPVVFLGKKHGRDSNDYQAIRVYKAQCRKPETLKDGMRGVVEDLSDRAFMIPYRSLTEDQRMCIDNALFRHFYIWRMVHKESSVTTPIRMVVDPSATGLNLILAKGENMIEKIPEILIAFRTYIWAWGTDVSKLYNMLFLKDSSLPYSLFFYDRSLQDNVKPEVYVMTRAWYGVSPTGNQANVALERLAKIFGQDFPAAEVSLLFCRYLDDMLSGADTPEAVEEQVRQVTEVLAAGGFSLKFIT
jgi:hypothetical protein